MYEPIDPYMICKVQNTAASTSQINIQSNEDRDIFVDSLLTNLLSVEKVREKDSLAEKIKYKKHQLELASKQIKKAEKLKRQQESNTRRLFPTKRKLTLSKKLRKSLKICQVDKKQVMKFENYEKINFMWRNYIANCLLAFMPKGLTEEAEARSQLLSEEDVINCLKQIDYHGAILAVKRSNCKTLIGLNGIVLQDKKNTFLILNKDNELKIVPKANSLFEFELFDAVKFTLVGSNMLHKPEMRVTKHAKIKSKLNIL